MAVSRLGGGAGAYLTQAGRWRRGHIARISLLPTGEGKCEGERPSCVQNQAVSGDFGQSASVRFEGANQRAQIGYDAVALVRVVMIAIRKVHHGCTVTGFS